MTDRKKYFFYLKIALLDLLLVFVIRGTFK